MRISDWSSDVCSSDLAPMLAAAGVRRINVSLDTLDGDAFRHITRVGDLSVALRGIDAARAAGLAVKINMVALAGLNEDQLLPRSEEHTSELQSLMRISYAVFCLKNTPVTQHLHNTLPPVPL